MSIFQTGTSSSIVRENIVIKMEVAVVIIVMKTGNFFLVVFTRAMGTNYHIRVDNLPHDS